MRNGCIFPRPPWAPAIDASAGSASPAAALWMTPTAQTFGEGLTPEQHAERTARLKEEFPGANGNGAGMLLTVQVQGWATPQSRDGDGRGAQASRHADPERKLAQNLDDQVAAMWTTPQASEPDSAERPSRKETGRTTEYLGRQVQTCHSFLPDRATATAGPESSPPPRGSRRRLNPAFVCWLMGMPHTSWTNPAWTSCARLVTAWLQRVRLLLSGLYGEGFSINDVP